MTAENRPAFCSNVHWLARSTGAGCAAEGMVGVSAACGASISMASSSRAGVTMVGVAMDARPFLLGAIAEKILGFCVIEDEPKHPARAIECSSIGKRKLCLLKSNWQV